MNDKISKEVLKNAKKLSSDLRDFKSFVLGDNTHNMDNYYHKRIIKYLKLLYRYEVNLTSYEKLVDDEFYLEQIKMLFERENIEETEKNKRYLRVVEEPDTFYVDENYARKELESCYINFKNQQTSLFDPFMNKEKEMDAMKMTYVFRDWYTNEFDELVDMIEPVRQKYIFDYIKESRTRFMRKLKPKDVDQYLFSKFFDTYEAYSNLAYRRSISSICYYPDAIIPV